MKFPKAQPKPLSPCDDCLVTIRGDKGPAVRFGNDNYEDEFPWLYDNYPLGVWEIIRKEQVEPYVREMRERELARMEPVKFELQIFRRPRLTHYGIKRKPTKVRIRKMATNCC